MNKNIKCAYHDGESNLEESLVKWILKQGAKGYKHAQVHWTGQDMLDCVVLSKTKLTEAQAEQALKNFQGLE